ncbi:MAG: c-type cytochrome [Saprospiraceae bacterium]|nr:c-type cytochrome [Candidatus Vicinibacter affinis]MBP6172812.1 c-type cytochrome [Saprospiraceae bacterium]MBK6572685.1 c-type cytochrome [Candidatus Vicinibacter affinis]MBK6824463.1 c-type cytochrome [Candidatus Vicinibacter affinis]MBK7303460.1 c-type cytochrome [Candidatus Vicinibacter affinis]
MRLIICCLLFISFLFSCQKNNEPEWAGLKIPTNFPAPVQKIEDLNITKAGFELGRKLFYDPLLSKDNTISCGSCHNQGSGFTHHGHDVSHGINDLLGRRNALPVQNLLWQNSFFWDGGVAHIDLISINPIQNPVEMDETLPNVLNKLRLHKEYPLMFENAFGDTTINSTRFLQAMTQFMALLVSADSKYDLAIRGEGPSLSPEEKEGKALFDKHCASCHSGELFSDFSFRNNGMFPNQQMDRGRYEISLLPNDIGKFKVPSLRNIAKTAPYMHNGSLNSLEDVLNHYTTGISASPTLDSNLMVHNKPGLQINLEQQKKIILFLHTLTDEKFLRKQEFSEQ